MKLPRPLQTSGSSPPDTDYYQRTVARLRPICTALLSTRPENCDLPHPDELAHEVVAKAMLEAPGVSHSISYLSNAARYRVWDAYRKARRQNTGSLDEAIAPFEQAEPGEDDQALANPPAVACETLLQSSPTENAIEKWALTNLSLWVGVRAGPVGAAYLDFSQRYDWKLTPEERLRIAGKTAGVSNDVVGCEIRCVLHGLRHAREHATGRGLLALKDALGEFRAHRVTLRHFLALYHTHAVAWSEVRRVVAEWNDRPASLVRAMVALKREVRARSRHDDAYWTAIETRAAETLAEALRLVERMEQYYLQEFSSA